MTTTTETMTTAEVIAAMLTENTGRHMLDSGGAYGRNFERNAGKTADDFRAGQEVHVEAWERDGKTVVEYVTLDVFHFLIERLDYDADLDAAFHDFALADERKDEPWFTCLDEWLDSIDATNRFTVNTYNGEDYLSQTIQYTVFDHPETDEPIAAISIHGGCDVRGGYTAPRMFSIGDAYALHDNADLEVYLTEPEPIVNPDQGTLIDLPPVYPRSVSIAIRGGYADRNPEPWDDKGLDVIDFHFGETPVVVGDDGTLVVAEGPAEGWTVEFYPPFPSY